MIDRPAARTFAAPPPRAALLHGASDEQLAAREDTIFHTICKRFPWLFVLMLVQSISGVVVEHFEGLVQKHVVLASFLTMLVGGGGNSSGQTIVETVRLLGAQKQFSLRVATRLVLKELTIGVVLAVLLGLCAYPRVRLISNNGGASHLDAVTIALAYAMIVAMANLIGVVVALTLHMCDMASVGAPPVVQVTVDVLGVTITMLVAQAIIGDNVEEYEAERAAQLAAVLPS